MKPSGGQYRTDVGESGPLSRGGSQHVSALTTTGPGGHPIYLGQHQSLSAAHLPAFTSQSSGNSPRGPSEYHPHHIPSGDFAHRSHLPAPTPLGINPGHVHMHLPQRRRTSGHRLSLLWDIGVAGERERDRAESSTAVSGSHVIPGAVVYGGRPNMSMMSSLGLQASQRNLASGSVPTQPPPGTPPRHSASTGQLNRPSTSLHGYPGGGGGSSFMLPGPSSIKTEPGNFVKEEAKSPMHSMTPHYPQMVHNQTFSGHPAIRTPSQGEPQSEKETENMPSKESLLQSMDKVDKEINKIASEIKGLERKKQQLETAAKKPPQTEKSTSPKKVETKHKDLWQVIYAENKRKAEAARGLLDHLCPPYDMPLYNQPSDTKVYQENLKKNEEMRPKLLAYFQRRSQLSNMRERYLCARYDQLMTDWQRKAERIENSIKRKTKEAKVREFFEKQFPEIRKQREQQERFSRSGTRGDTCRSEADFNEIVDGLSEQENQEQHMRQLAVVPPMLLDREERRLKFINNNGLVTDPMEDYKKRQELDHWSEQEKEVFKEKYVQHPKNFHVIASFLEKKSVSDCVLFYYLSKKKAGYKNLVRKNTLKTRKVKPVRSQAQQGSNNSAQDVGKNGQQIDKGVGDKFTGLKDSLENIVKEEEIERIDRPPSPRVTRSRNKNMNWTDEDIVMAKEGFGKHGKDFAAISRLFPNKTEVQIKHFYTQYKKKHNLDQLISDGKKKKPRTRTQALNSESTSSTPPEVDNSSAEASRPRSADPQVSIDQPEPSKKRKKEADNEKKEELKEDNSKLVDNTTVSPPEVESTPAPPRVTSSSTSQIRTRRSAVASSSNAESVKVSAQSGKRSSESSPVEEPAEKKPRKSKQVKESKVEGKEPAPEEKKVEDKTPENTEQKTKKYEKEPVVDENTAVSGNPPTPVSKPSTSTVATSAAASGENPVDTVVIFPSEAPKEAIQLPKAEPSPQTVPPATAVTQTESVMVEHPAKDQVSPSVSPVQQTVSNDGDSSATCSADEEPDLQDTEKKAVSRKHSDSPYAFEDESSASIKLETSRAPMPPLSSAQSLQTNEQFHEHKTSQDGRPSSTHPPQPVIVKTEDKRPQSLPPADIPPVTGPITSLGFLAPIRKQSHIVGKVPDFIDVRRALQSVQVPSVPKTTLLYSGSKKPAGTDLLQTIDLTIASATGDDSSKEPKSQILPHYHPVPEEAMSLHKDFAERKSIFPEREEPPFPRRGEYTPMDIASMQDRAATIPILVSSLRAPMPGVMQRKEVRRPEPIIKKEISSTPPETNLLVKHMLMHPLLAHNTALTGRPHLTTSSIPTKIISGSMMSGAPLRQNPPPSSYVAGLPIPSETQRTEVISPAQLIHPSDAPPFRRSPVPEVPPHPHIAAMGSYPDIPKSLHPISRSSIVKIAGVPSLEPALAEDRKGKSGLGSITTGLPLHRTHDDREEQKTAFIAGKQVLVKQPRASPHLEHARSIQEAERQHLLRFPSPGVAHGHPLIPGLPQKPLQSAGSIHDGRPVVKRKASDESNSSLSPSANPTPYPGGMVSRPSPTAVSTSARLPERNLLTLERNAEAVRSLYPGQYPLLTDRSLKEAEIYHHRQTPEKLVRDPGARVPSPRHRHTPTGPSLSQHPAVKQELPSSPHSEEFLRAQPALPQQMFLNPLAFPLTTPAVSKDFLEVLRQYRQTGLPTFVSGQYGSLIHPSASPLAPGSPQNDDGRETTKNMLNQDFKTAQMMINQLRQPAQVTLPTGFFPGVPPALTTPGIGPPPLVVSTPSLYHPMANLYPGLAVDRVNFIPNHPGFSPLIPQQSGRSSTESNRSPSHKPSPSLSPEAERYRHRSSDMPAEYSNHPAVKERNSATSPYRILRENPSPHRYPPPVPSHQQLSPSQLSQPPKPFRSYPHSSTPPLPSSHHRSIPKSSHIPAGVQFSYLGHEPSIRIHDSYSPRSKHSRSESLDGSTHQSLVRPGSASPHPKSLPQSPNDVPEQPSKYSTHIKHSSSPKYRQEQKLEAQPAHGITNEQRVPVRDDRPPIMQHRDSPRLPPKHTTDRSDQRSQQNPALVARPHQVTPPLSTKHEPRPSSVQHKERIPVEQVPHKVQVPVKPEQKQESIQGISSNPGADLKNCGRTKMKAATLIDHIINMNFDMNSSSKTSEPTERTHRGAHSQKAPMPSQIIPGPCRSSDSSEKRPIEGGHSPKREVTPSKQTPFEAETKQPSGQTRGYPSRPFTMAAFAQSPVVPPPQVKDKTTPVPLSHLTFAKHSSQVIDQCYRKAIPPKRGSPVRSISPAIIKPTAMVPEPISPPEKRLSSGRSEVKPPHAHPVYSPFLPQQRLSSPAPETISRSRMEPAVDSSRTYPPPVRPSAQQPINPSVVTQSGSLEDIIRKALMNENKPSPDLSQSRTNHAIGGLEAPSLSGDMIFSQAIYAASRTAPRPSIHPQISGSERKGTPPTAQPQSGSEKYMSALMFRTPTQNATPPAAERHQQQFYQSQARPPPVASSQSPAPPEPNISQTRPGMLPKPQYEALSDSD